MAKGIGFQAGQSPFGPANEFLCALLSREVDIPINDFALLNYRGETLFGSRWIPDGLREYCFKLEQLEKCQNSDIVYKIVPFDVFMCNTDRHARNLLIRHQREAHAQDTRLLLANDHDRCLLPDGTMPEELASVWESIPSSRFMRSGVVRQYLQSPVLLEEGILNIEALTDELIKAAVSQVPDQWLSRIQKRMIRSFLFRRRYQVRAIVRELTNQCPNFPKGGI